MKELRKCYRFLQLPYGTNTEKVQIRENALIKYYRAVGIKRGKSFKNKIEKITKSANFILEYLKTNEVEFKDFRFESNIVYIREQLFIVVVLIAICFSIFYLLLK